MSEPASARERRRDERVKERKLDMYTYIYITNGSKM